MRIKIRMCQIRRIPWICPIRLFRVRIRRIRVLKIACSNYILKVVKFCCYITKEVRLLVSTFEDAK